MKGYGIGSVALIAVMATLLGGCGQRQEEATGLEGLRPDGQSVTFWYQHTEEREAALRDLIQRFNQTNPHGITVRGEYIGSHDDVYNKMLVHMQSGVLPQLVVAYRYQAQAYYQNQAVVDLQPYINSPRWGLSADERTDYFTEFLEQDRVQGAQIAFLPSRSMEVLYYNVDWLRELGEEGPPRDWQRFAQLCRRAVAQPFSRAQGRRPGVGLALNVDASRLAAMVFSRGGDFINTEGTAYTLDTVPVREALTMLRDLVQSRAALVAAEDEEMRAAFARGKALFVMRSSSGLALYRSDVAAAADFMWDVAPVPYTGQVPVLDVYGASLAVCRTTPEQQLAAWLFIKWFTQPEQQSAWSQQTGYFPVRRSAARDVASYFRVSYGLLELGKPEPWVIGYGAVRQMIEQAMVDVLGGADLEETLRQLEEQANRTIGG